MAAILSSSCDYVEDENGAVRSKWTSPLGNSLWLLPAQHPSPTDGVTCSASNGYGMQQVEAEPVRVPTKVSAKNTEVMVPRIFATRFASRIAICILSIHNPAVPPLLAIYYQLVSGGILLLFRKGGGASRHPKIEINYFWILDRRAGF